MPEELPQTLQSVADNYWQRLPESRQSWPANTQQLVKRLFGLSDFIAEQVIRYPEWSQVCCSEPTEQVDYQAQLQQLVQSILDEKELMQKLRQFRHREMLRIAAWDLLNKQDIEVSLQQVSELADALIMSAYQWQYQALVKRYGEPLGEHGPQPMLIIAMGKLGGKELNFSSDIDLIFVYPSQGEIQSSRKTIEHQQFFTKLGQKLISSLHQITADGQVFRVDMRLRPFGESGPLVTHFDAIEDYYQEQGREWERYAMLKGRILNPDSPYKQELEDILKPFVFRRYIDFSVLDSLRDMKRLIQQEIRRRNLNNNIKLGSGGIREIEFIVQCFQLTRGGRIPQLQTRHLITVLEQLQTLDILSSEDTQNLQSAYRYLRKIEHCLQQFDDKQTQTLPDDDIDKLRLAQIMGTHDYEATLDKIREHMTIVNAHFQELIGESEPEDIDSVSSKLCDLWQLPLSEEEASKLLQDLLPDEWHSPAFQHLTALKTEVSKKPLAARGRDALDKLMPLTLDEWLALESEQPIDLLARIMNIIRSILRRTAYLDLLIENHEALQQLVRLCQHSPWIADQLARFPLLLDELIDPSSLYQPTPLSEYPDMLRRALLRVPEEDLELSMETLRQFKLSQQLRVAAEDITGHLPLMKVSDHLSALAETIIAEVIQMAWFQMSEKYGVPEGTAPDNMQFAVVGYGKLGGLELGYSSDLDLVFVHNCPQSVKTNGTKQIEAGQFYLKLAQRILHLFNTKTASGELYEIDMRLRPSGNAGLLVTHIDAFKQYQLNEAWTWEHQALLRSRPVAGTPELCQLYEEVRQEILSQPREQPPLQQEVQKMRNKMRQHLDKSTDSQFDLKQGEGGITDIEFLTQYWGLYYASQNPEVIRWSDNIRILETLAQHGFITNKQQETLTETYKTLRDASHRRALTYTTNSVSADEYLEHRKQVQAIWHETLGDEVSQH
ncbi:MAG: bifunctional [glutamate--ammonia ligase]-adenylyl-L-tyrosine phosphorylase/[glutamate--ammonia-ligase] adenylyltransferase [Aestuariibacter sp.]